MAAAVPPAAATATPATSMQNLIQVAARYRRARLSMIERTHLGYLHLILAGAAIGSGPGYAVGAVGLLRGAERRCRLRVRVGVQVDLRRLVETPGEPKRAPSSNPRQHGCRLRSDVPKPGCTALGLGAARLDDPGVALAHPCPTHSASDRLIDNCRVTRCHGSYWWSTGRLGDLAALDHYGNLAPPLDSRSRLDGGRGGQRRLPNRALNSRNLRWFDGLPTSCRPRSTNCRPRGLRRKSLTRRIKADISAPSEFRSPPVIPNAALCHSP
jgi:hypothetical protein